METAYAASFVSRVLLVGGVASMLRPRRKQRGGGAGGEGGEGGGQQQGTQPGTYTITVTGTSGTLAHQISAITLVVN
jgi:hypothetical protein